MSWDSSTSGGSGGRFLWSGFGKVDRETEALWLASPLAVWMANHADAAEILKHDGMNWDKSAEALTAFGLETTAAKRPPPRPPARLGCGWRSAGGPG